jgi:(1->4)-alpha-D-glucan 1-alpha-D-glucosylmutase
MPAPPPDRIPVSTYRLQVNSGFTLHDAARAAGYLSDLGVTELYLSPILAAAPGSMHGYDICDYNRINPEIGGEEALLELSARLKERNLGLILDFVPNHMGTNATVNTWWRDVLENGPSSAFANFFDIDWHPVKRELQDKVLLPVLGDQYGIALDRGDFRIEFSDGAFGLQYFDRHLPLNPRQMLILLNHRLDELKALLPSDDPQLIEFLSVLFQLEHLPSYRDTSAASMEDRQREKEVARARLAALSGNSEAIRTHIESNILEFNGTAGDSDSFRLLHGLLEAQPYRLASWKTATHEINYRRFFDINELAGIRMEDAGVFSAAHALLLRLIKEGVATGLRLDHVDGLFDPRSYFEALHRAVGPDRPIYLVAEKILSENEQIREDWEIHGTTGYDFLNVLNGVFVDRRNAHEFQKLYRRAAGVSWPYPETVYHSKKLIIETAMASELNVLAQRANRISESDPHSRDFTLMSLQAVLTEVVACFPVYRTYVDAGGWNEFDEQNVNAAVAEALVRNPALESSIFLFVRDLLLPEPRTTPSPEERKRRLRFAMKTQQYTGPVQAKGVEDTAFYRYGPLLSLNEVGGHPSSFGMRPEEFHAANRQRLERFPLSLTCTSTHDTKRGEDARARLNVLSEIPDKWREQVAVWARINSSAHRKLNQQPAPERSDEYFYYQALIGGWPADCDGSPSPEFVERVRQYMNKAVKEKKFRTSWIAPSADYDAAVAWFVEQTLAGTRAQPFLARFLPFQRRVAELGMVNSLAQLVLKIASPGVPDFYQGSELWNLSFVDPDNRRPVDVRDFQRELSMLGPALEHPSKAAAARLLSNWKDGCVKLFATAAGLRLRRRYADLFLRGEYRAAEAAGPAASNVIAFSRTLGGEAVLAVAPRLTTGICGFDGGLPLGPAVWGDTRLHLPPGHEKTCFQDVFTGAVASPEPGGTLEMAKLLDTLPCALLIGGAVEDRE